MTQAGLSGNEAAARLKRYGANVVRDESRSSAARLLLRQFRSPLVLILVFGAAVSLLLQEWLDATIILAIVFGSALLGFHQEYRASAAVRELRKRLALTVQVVRDGAIRSIAASEVVPGDVVLLSAGNLVPADGKILEARDFLVSEAGLTGESFPVEKERDAKVFMGTSVRSGTARVEIESTGRNTAYAQIAARLSAPDIETNFAQGVRQFGYLLVRVTVVTIVFVLIVNQWMGRPPVESLLYAIALAVGVTPELLPAIVSVTLSRGAREMAARGVIVRRLEAIENLGSMDVFCTDKTGTLTEGTVVLDSAVDAEGRASPEVLTLAYINAAFETGIDNPLDAAIVKAGERERITSAGYTKVDEIPYDFLRRRLTIVAAPDADPDRHLVIMKGAVANVLAACSIDPAMRERVDAYYRHKSAEGCRMLAVATRRVAAKARYGHDDEADMTLVGFLIFFDPPKAAARKAIEDLAARGIAIKIVTGDNRYVAAHVARAVGLDADAMLAGDEIARLDGEALAQRAERTALFVEVDPQQKERIVRALQHRGHSVGYLGDGINDAPALHAADVGISVDSAVDVARESADVVLLRPDLDALRRGVEDGRRTFANTLKYICITTSANFGNVISMALATPLLPFLPLVAKQILLNNFLSDMPMMAVSTDAVDPHTVTCAQRWDMAHVRSFMIVFGLISTSFDLLSFVVLMHVFNAPEATFQTAWFVVSLLTEIAVILVLRTELPAWRSRPGRLLLQTTVLIAAVALCIPYMGGFSRAFGFVPLSLPVMGAMIAIVLAYVLATEAAKLLLRNPASTWIKFWRAARS